MSLLSGVKDIFRRPGSAAPPSGYPSWQGGDWALLAFFLATLIVISPIGQALAIFALISLIGIPIYVILAAVPMVFIAILFWRVADHTRLSIKSGSLVLTCIFAAAGLLLADFFLFGAWRENARLARQAEIYTAGDVDLLATPAPIRTLAVVRNTRSQRDNDTGCDDLCQRLLLNNGASRVLTVALAPPAPLEAEGAKGKGKRRPPLANRPDNWPLLHVNDAQAGTIYWLEQRGECGNITVPEQSRLLQIREPRPNKGGTRISSAVKAADAMRLRIASGSCLMSRPATLADADSVLMFGTLASGMGDFAAADQPSAETLSAWRGVFMQRKAQSMEEVFRSTGVHYLSFPYIRAISFVHGYQFALKTGFVRMNEYRGARTRYESQFNVAEFVTGRLGLQLVLDQSAGPAGGENARERILSSSGDVSDIDRKIIQDFVEHLSRIAYNRDASLSPDDARRVLRIAADRRFELPLSFASAAALVANQAPDLAPELVRELFARLAKLPNQPQGLADMGQWREKIQRTSGALARMPANTLTPHRREMEKLARTHQKRDVAHNLLGQLNIFGADITPLLTEMLLDADREINAIVDNRRSRSSGHEAYDVALENLCKLGSQASSALPVLRAQIERPNSRLKRSKFNQTVATLALMGMSEDEVRQLMSVNSEDPKAARQFHFAWQGASRKNPC